MYDDSDDDDSDNEQRLLSKHAPPVYRISHLHMYVRWDVVTIHYRYSLTQARCGELRVTTLIAKISLLFLEISRAITAHAILSHKI